MSKTRRSKAKLSQQSIPKSQTRSQASDNIEVDNTTIEDLSHKCVRYFLTRMGSNLPIKRTDIVQYVFQEKPGKSFNIVLENAISYLKDIYGLTIELVDTDSSVKKYFVNNALPYAHLIPNDPTDDMKSNITFLILSHIFMSKNSSTDASLWQFLEEFGITPTTECEHIGNIKTFIMQTLVKQGYVALEDRGGEHEDGELKKKFMWGSRAEEVVSKMEILKFVAELYDTDVKTWEDQYKVAKDQFRGCEEE